MDKDKLDGEKPNSKSKFFTNLPIFWTSIYVYSLQNLAYL